MIDSDPTPEKLWTPSGDVVAAAQITAFTDWLARARARRFNDYESLWEWSANDLEGFWAAVWDYFAVASTRGYERVLARDDLPGAQWFVGAELNVVDQIFRGRTSSALALRFHSEAAGDGAVTWGQLEREVAALAETLHSLGVRPGDRVAAVLPNVPHTVVAMLAVASVGAVWSVCAPDMGPRSISDRFRQIEPVVLIASDGYRFSGKIYNRIGVLTEVLENLPTVRTLITVPLIGAQEIPAAKRVLHRVHWQEATAGDFPLRTASLPFDHPLWILYSSGTTGLPKAIVHGHGGVLLNALVLSSLHLDLRPGDLFMWPVSTAWVVWNIQVMALTVGATIMLYDGAVNGPAPGGDPGYLWDVVARAQVTVLGAGAAYFANCLKAGLCPRERADLAALRTVIATGSPLSSDCYRWIYRDVKPDIWLANISGGTEIAGAFLVGNPTLPVYLGEMQCRSLGAAVYAFNAQGQPVLGEVGELVCTRPLPSMPLRFWNDPGDRRLRESYFESIVNPQRRPVWRHGDWLRLSQRPESVTAVIFGRSDATVNRQGIRMGTAEFYRVIEEFPEVTDSLVVDLEYLGRDPYLALFVVLRANLELSDQFRQQLRDALRGALSPRHVPTEILQVPEVPRTLTGKKLEVPVRRLLLGHDIDKVVSRDALANPASLDWYVEFSQTFQARRA